MDQDKPIYLKDILTKPFYFTYTSNNDLELMQFFHQQFDLSINLDTTFSRPSKQQSPQTQQANTSSSC